MSRDATEFARGLAEDGIDTRPPATLVRQRGNAEDHRSEPVVSTVAHLVHFYEDDEFLSVAVAKFLGDGIRAGDVLVVIATEPHRQAFRRQLESLGFDADRVC